MSAHEETRHFRTQAVTMLAIATGTLGFGLFGAEFRVSTEFLPMLMFGAAGCALLCYVALVKSVETILSSDDVSGRWVAQEPMMYMFLVVAYVVCVFVAGVFDSPPSAY